MSTARKLAIGATPAPTRRLAPAPSASPRTAPAPDALPTSKIAPRETSLLASDLQGSSFQTLRETLVAAVRAGKQSEVEAVLHHILGLAETARWSRDVRNVVTLRGQVRRLARRAAQTPTEHTALLASVKIQFDVVDQSLDAARTAMLTQHDADVDADTSRLLRDRMLDVMTEGQHRPRDIAQALGVDSTQISRALRALQQDELILRVERPTGDSDARAHWYALAEPRKVEGTSAP